MREEEEEGNKSVGKTVSRAVPRSKGRMEDGQRLLREPVATNQSRIRA